MFTATWPEEVQRVANDLLLRPPFVRIAVGGAGVRGLGLADAGDAAGGDEPVANKRVTQTVEVHGERRLLDDDDVARQETVASPLRRPVSIARAVLNETTRDGAARQETVASPLRCPLPNAR